MYKRIEHDGKKYCIMTVFYKENKVPVLFDQEYEEQIKSFNKNWKCNTFGNIFCLHSYNNSTYEIKLHEIIMALHEKKLNISHENNSDKTILHINKLGIDNRIDNLMYDMTNKDITKNMKKKKRTIVLPENCGINPNEIPTYVWYVKPEGTHGERFIVILDKVKWKSSCSKKLSLRYKLEETKAYLRLLKQNKPELFSKYSMNGDYNAKGEELLKSFYDIIYQAGFSNIKKITLPCMTNEYLKPQNVMKSENILLTKNINAIINNEKRCTIKCLPSGISDLPKKCYYHPETSSRGSYFIMKINNENINMKSKYLISSTSKNISDEEKYKQIIKFSN